MCTVPVTSVALRDGDSRCWNSKPYMSCPRVTLLEARVPSWTERHASPTTKKVRRFTVILDLKPSKRFKEQNN